MYSRPFRNRIKYRFEADISAGLTTAGGADAVIGEWAIKGPRGKAGVLYDYGFEGVTTALSSQAAFVAVGTTADVDAYGEEIALQNLGAEDAITARNNYRDGATTFHSSTNTELEDFILPVVIPANQKVILTVQSASTDATGIGTAFAIIDWQT